MNRYNGLTTVELLISLAIAAILIATALPSMSRALDHYRLEAGVQSLIRSLAFARSEAIKRATRVSLVNTNGNWESGWKIFEDDNGNSVPDDDEALLLEQSPTLGITARGNLTVKSLITYQADGGSIMPNNSFQAGTITLCAADPTIQGYKIVLGRGGRNHSQRLPNGSAECATH